MPDFLRKFLPPGRTILAAIVLVLAVSGLLLVQSLWAGGDESGPPPGSFSAINLAGQRWYARQGFSAEDARGFNPDLPGVKEITQFPVQLNAVFNIPPGDKTNDFALMLLVNLDAQAVAQNLMLNLSQIGDNWAIYLNGSEIHREMVLAENGQIRRHRTLQNVLVPLPQRLIRTGANTLVFQIKGNPPTNPFFPGWQVGFSVSNGYLLGSAASLIKERTLQDAFSWLQMGVYFFFGLLQIFLYFRQKEIYSLYFSIFLCSCAVYSFSYSNVAFNLMPDTAVIYRMMFGTNFIWPGLVGLTLWSYFYPNQPPGAWLTTMVAITLALTLGVWLVPFEWAETLLAAFLPLVIIFAVFILRMIIRAARQGVRDAGKILVSGSAIFVVIFWTVLDLFIFRTGVDLVGWTPFILAVVFALIFIDRLWVTTLELSASNRQVSLMRDNLESQVILRTIQLSEANARLEDKLTEINALQESLREMALRDALTGLYNRRYLTETLDREFALIKRQHLTCLVMIDIDHFKILNDTYGHKAGDEVLKELSAFMGSCFRPSDLIFRFGGEEFLIVLSGTNRDEALRRTDQLRLMIEHMVVKFDDQMIKFTISAGVAEILASDEVPDQALKRADSALYAAKSRGRNRVEAADEPE